MVGHDSRSHPESATKEQIAVIWRELEARERTAFRRQDWEAAERWLLSELSNLKEKHNGH